ncbi:MAG: hypothetical protein KBT21_07045 [Treponema sp.]|nr:hypothetical protein [Candidatus Treponema merdequi]
MNQKIQPDNLNSSDNVTQWASEKEVIKTSFPIYLTLFCIKCFPKFLLNGLIRIIGFFFFVFNKRAKSECLRFQNQFKSYCQNFKQKIPNVYKQIVCFAITFVEKMECWVKKNPGVKVEFSQGDDVYNLINHLNSGKGAFVVVSHLGNSEVLRCLANRNDICLNKKVPIAVLMDLGSTSNFTNTIEKLNPGFTENIVDVNNITPATIEHLEEVIEQGGMVVSAGDRVSKNADSRFIKADFLGKEAPWSYGVYLIAMLLKAPVYFLFGTRKKDVSFNRKYHVHVVKSSVETDCARKDRETNLKNLCFEFVRELEKVCLEHPFQWYNFYNFWADSKDEEKNA